MKNLSPNIEIPNTVLGDASRLPELQATSKKIVDAGCVRW